jgi:hypothetical protein
MEFDLFFRKVRAKTDFADGVWSAAVSLSKPCLSVGMPIAALFARTLCKIIVSLPLQVFAIRHSYKPVQPLLVKWRAGINSCLVFLDCSAT